jgi:predicted permease
VAIRTALGAGQGRLARQFLTESVLLALAGGVLGVGFALAGVNALLAANPDSVVRLDRVGLDLRILGFTLLVALLTGLLFGLAPALHARARALLAGLREGGRTTAGRARHLFRASLVVAEVALAAVLVIGAGLLIRSFTGLQRVDPGFDPRGLLTLQVSLPEAVYPEAGDVQALYERLLAQVRALPGVASAAAMTGLPPVRDVNANDTEFESVPEDPQGPAHNVDYYQTVSLGYFEAMGIPLVAGRAFEPPDAGGPPVAIVNQTLARLFWPQGDPLGQRLRPCCGDENPWLTIVGVARDVKQGGLARPTGTELYFLADQAARAGFAARARNLVVRAAGGDPLAPAAPVRAEVRRLDAGLPVAQLRPMEEVLAGSIGGSRFLTLLVGVFAVVALALAAVGTYGVLAYAVEQRRHEMGVRMALGARAGGLLRMVLGQGMRLAAAGLVLGLAGAWALRRLIAGLLFEIAPGDPATFAGVAAVLASVALGACLIPARRATRVDPVVSLRVE